jgi:hypothetical protein
MYKNIFFSISLTFALLSTIIVCHDDKNLKFMSMYVSDSNSLPESEFSLQNLQKMENGENYKSSLSDNLFKTRCFWIKGWNAFDISGLKNTT